MKLKYKGTHIYKPYGVKKENNRYSCIRCNNKIQELFHTYKEKRGVCTYCLNCINLGKSDSLTPLYYEKTINYKDNLTYTLNFKLNVEQQHASYKVEEAIKNKKDLILYAVTGAGKTEITFQGIQYARNNGLKVAFVSPRVDVVREVYMRLKEAFTTARIDLLYANEKIVMDYVFTVCTVHQLYNFIEHFDVIIVDEVDAFPLVQDKILQGQLKRSLKKQGSTILLTATPDKALIRGFKNAEIVSIKRRYHGYKLTIPQIIYEDIERSIKKKKIPRKLNQYLKCSIDQKRKVLVFVPEIRLLEPLVKMLRKTYTKIDSVYSGDPFRKQKVEKMRKDELDILVTTTILERGVTFKYLDVFVVHAEYFDSRSLIQIAGRAGRKVEDPIGNVYLFTKYNTLSLLKTKSTIKAFNKGQISL